MGVNCRLTSRETSQNKSRGKQMQQTEKQQKEKEPVKKRFKKLRTGRIGEENLENKVLDEDFSLL